MKNYHRFFIFPVLICLLISCGGGSGGGGKTSVFTIPESVVQKGPFISGSTITIQVMDSSFNPTGENYSIQTKNDLGEFSLESEIKSNIIEVIANGFYFNEITGSLSDSELTLRAILDLSESDSVNVNILTSLTKDRIIYLVKKEGKAFTAAKKQAEKELLGAFNINSDDVDPFENMDISREGESNAILLAVSAILQGSNTVAELSELISKINIDLEEDGVLNNNSVIKEIRDNSAALDLVTIRTNIAARYSSLGLSADIPVFEDFTDRDGDGKINRYDTFLNFETVTGAHLDYTYTTNQVTVGLMPDVESDVININSGTIVINGTDTGQQSAVVKHGDKVAVKYVVSLDSTIIDITLGNNTGHINFNYDVFHDIDSTPDWSSSTGHTSVVFDNKMWVIGGSDRVGLKNDVWYSSDGITWTRATSAAQWSARMYHASVVFDNKMWVIGGDSGGGKNDVWYSSDGITWTQATAAAQWSGRYWHTSLVFDNKMWVIGGDSGGGKNDVWYSSDGITWTRATAAAQWFARVGHTSVVFDNKMWVIGGDAGVLKNDVWYSSDGINWTQATESAQWLGRMFHTSVVYSNKIWIVSGVNTNIFNEAWFSSNGVDWIKFDNSNLLERYCYSSVVFDNKLWIIGGYYNEGVAPVAFFY